MKTVRRWLGPIKRRLSRTVEIKAGIMLQQPVVASPNLSHAKQEIVETSEYRTDLAFSESEFERRRRNGNVLYELFVDQKSVSYGWVAQPGTQVGILHDLQMKVPDHALYIWDCATPPENRGQGYFQALLRGLVTGSRSDATLVLVAVDTGNAASRKALAKAGFRPMFTYLSVSVLGRGLISFARKNGKLTEAQPQFDQIGEF